MFDGVRLEDASAHQLRMALAVKATELEADVVSGADAAGLVEDFARIEAIGHSALVLMANRAVESGVWKRKGHKTPAHWLAAVAGVSVSTAQRILATSKRIKDQPKTRKSATKGNLGRDKLHDVSEAAGAAPDQEEDLVGNAERDSVASNRERCRNTKANAMSDEEKRRQSQRNRRVRRRSEPDGSAGFEYMAPSDQAAEVFAALEHFQRLVFDAARKAGTPRESFENHAADAVLMMARAAMGNVMSDTASNDRVAKPQITIRIDWEALKRGAAMPGETCDIPGVGPVPVATVRALLDDALVRVVVTRGIDVVAVAHHGRSVSAHQRTGLQWMHTKCSVLGCDNAVAIELDHRKQWSEEKITAFLNMDPLCSHHHYLKGYRKHRLEPGTGRRRMLGPDEPDPPTPVNGPPVPRPTAFRDPEPDDADTSASRSDRPSPAGTSAGASSPFEDDTDQDLGDDDGLADEIIDLRDAWPDVPASRVDPGTGGPAATGDRSPPVDATLF